MTRGEPREANPIEAWGRLSERAARASGVRSMRRGSVRRRSSAAGIGGLMLAVVIVGAAIALRPATQPAANGSVTAVVDDGMFRLELTTPQSAYTADEEIDPIARLTYLGPDDSVTTFHGTAALLFSIEEIGGTRSMDGALGPSCASSVIRRDGPLVVPFFKSGAMDESFDRAWWDTSTLRLPPGMWRISAYTVLSTDDGPTPTDGSLACGTRGHDLKVHNDVDVVGTEPSASPEPSETAAASRPTIEPSTRPSPTLSADASIAKELVRKYEDGLTTGHAEVSWRFLAPWTRTAIGSFATFSDGSRRRASPSDPPVIEDPTQDPDLLDPAFLGARAADIAAVADPGRAYVVSVRRPEVDGAAAATENLVVAPIDGDWRIWLDVAAGSFGAVPFPQGCPAFELSDRRCEAVVAEAARQAGVDRTRTTATTLPPDPGCGGDPLASDLLLCARTMSFVAGVRFDLDDGRQVRHDIFCGVGPPSLVCSENPGIEAIGLGGAGYWDVPCTGEAPDGCPSPIPSPTGPGGRALRIATVEVPVGAVGHHEVELGTAVLVDGVLQKAEFAVTDAVQDGFLLSTGMVTLELRSTIPGRPPFDNAYARGTFDGPEEVRVFVAFDVAETSPGAVIHLADVLVR